jgi:hypothetical protein
VASVNGTPRPGQRWVDRVTGESVIVLFVDSLAVTVIDVDENAQAWTRQTMRVETLMREFELRP